MDNIYKHLQNTFGLFKKNIFFNYGDTISFTDKEDNSFFLMRQSHAGYTVQFQTNCGLKTISHSHTYDKMNNNIAEDLFGEFLDAKKKVKKLQLSNKLDTIFLDSECENVISKLKDAGYITNLQFKKFDAYCYYEFLYLKIMDVNLTCLYTMGTLKIKIHNKNSTKNYIHIIKLSNNDIDLEKELNMAIQTSL
jgi:hypothetical protein